MHLLCRGYSMISCESNSINWKTESMKLYRSMPSDAEHKVDMLVQRFALIQQKVLRQECFRPKLIKKSSNVRTNSSENDDNATTVSTPIESLLGRKGSHNLLGMIVQVEEGRFYLEDLSGQVPLDLSKAQVLSDSLICENCVVLVEGEMRDGILHTFKIGCPPPESRHDSFRNIGIEKSDIFGDFSSEAEMQKLYDQEVENGVDTVFVVLSELHLDKPNVLTKLEKMFEGFSEVSPLPIFVLMGNFTSCWENSKQLPREQLSSR